MSSAAVRPPPAPKIGEQVAADLRARIARGELHAGERLATEEELLVEFGAARNTLREAFRILESEGLLEVRRGRTGGVFIAHPGVEPLARGFAVRLMLDGTNLGDLYAARQHIELALLAELAKKPTRRALDSLQAAIDVAAEAANANDARTFGIAAAGVHETIVVEAGNQTLATFARLIHELTERTYAELRPDQALMQRAVRSYRRLYRLVEERNVEAAVEHLRKQMGFTRGADPDRWTTPVDGL